MKKLLTITLSFLACFTMLVGAAACNDKNSSSSSDSGVQVPAGKVQFDFTVKLADGTVVANSTPGVILCNGDNCTPYTTDANGKVSVQVDDIAGWTAHVEYPGYDSPEWAYEQSDDKTIEYTFVLTPAAE